VGQGLTTGSPGCAIRAINVCLGRARPCTAGRPLCAVGTSVAPLGGRIDTDLVRHRPSEPLGGRGCAVTVHSARWAARAPETGPLGDETDTIAPMSDAPSLPAPLLAGFQRFRAGRFSEDRHRYRALAEHGQRPTTMLIACSDSRSSPEQVFDAAPGELFVVRNIAGWVPAYAPDTGARSTAAALEYAIRVLPVETIVVMGHGGCGGVRAAIDPSYGPPTSEFVGPWIRTIEDIAGEAAANATATGTRDDLQHRVELLTVERSVANLATYPWIADRIGTGGMTIGGAWFAIATGELDAFGPYGWRRVEADTPGG
jgi:carbonic anhydrase